MNLEDFIASPKPRKRVYLSFGVGSAPIEVKNIETKNFSEKESEETQEVMFSLRERIRYSKMTPKMILRLRIREVANYCRTASVEKITANREIILTYINEYVYQQIVNLIHTSGKSQFNLILQLGLNNIMKNTQNTRAFQRLMIRIKRYLLTNGTIPLVMQTKLQAAYVKFWKDLIDSIEKRYLPKEKWGLLTEGKVDDKSTSMIGKLDHVDPKEAPKDLKNFSEDINDEVPVSETKDVTSVESADHLAQIINDYFKDLDPESSIEDIVSFLNSLRSESYTIDPSIEEDFLEKDILSDEELTKLIANYVFRGEGLIELTKYLSDSMSNKSLVNFSNVTIYPGLVQWNEDRTKCYFPGNDLNWYVFEIKKEGDQVRLVAISRPNTIPFKEEDPDTGTIVYDKVEESELDARMNIAKAIDLVCSKIKCFSENKDKSSNLVKKTSDYELYNYSIGNKSIDLLITNFSDNKNVVEVKVFNKNEVPEDIDKRLEKSPDKIYSEVTKDELEEIKSNFSSGRIV